MIISMSAFLYRNAGSLGFFHSGLPHLSPAFLLANDLHLEFWTPTIKHQYFL